LRTAERPLLTGRVKCHNAPAAGSPGSAFDLVTMFRSLHDMGDPVGSAKPVRELLPTAGTWMIVEPRAGDAVEDNLNPVGRAYYAFSTLLCTPSSLSQDGGLALGAQAGPARLREVLTTAGFSTARVAAETPVNIVLEARPYACVPCVNGMGAACGSRGSPTATARRRSCCCRRGRSSRRGCGSCRSRTWPATTACSRSTGAAPAAPAPRSARRTTPTRC